VVALPARWRYKTSNGWMNAQSAVEKTLPAGVNYFSYDFRRVFGKIHHSLFVGILVEIERIANIDIGYFAFKENGTGNINTGSATEKRAIALAGQDSAFMPPTPHTGHATYTDFAHLFLVYIALTKSPGMLFPYFAVLIQSRLQVILLKRWGKHASFPPLRRVP